MFKYRSNANRSLFSNKIFYVRHCIPWLILLLLLIFTRSTHARIVATRGSRELQTTSKVSSSLVESQRDDLRHALYVISLDGKITALNVDDHGQQVWIADTGTPLVDSSLSKIEITRESGSVHLIPSLIGGLYERYDDDGHIEASPFDADSLLDASFKLQDDLVITGGKHIDTLGLDSQTGQVIYSFSKDNVKEQKTTDQNNSRSTLVVKRTIQTVRARSIRSGYEKWNFSVSNHELIYLHGQPSHVVVDHTSTGADFYQYQLQAGIIVAFDRDRKILWTSSINAPIAAVWEYKNGRLTERSLFDHDDSMVDDDDNDDDVNADRSVSHPMAFIGEYNATPYVLVSESIQKQLIHSARKIASSPRRSNLLAWDKAYQKRTIYIEGDSGPREKRYPIALRPSSTQRQSSTDSNDQRTCETFGYFALTNLLITDESDERRMGTRSSEASYLLTLSTVVIGALVTLISYRVYKKTQTKILRQQSSMTDMGTDFSNQQTTTSSSTMVLESQSSEIMVTPPFQSRYNLEYEHVRFLGRGGFGVVFEAINKLDERRVAIKRVSLKRTSGKERALKEIRYLAALNHRHLIQYYYAWNESPPVGWQEDEDKRLLIRTHHMTNRDSISSFPTSANDSESIHQRNTSKLPSKPTFGLTNPIIEFTFDRSSNPLRIDEDFSDNSNKENQCIQQDESSDSESSSKRNRRLTTTKSSMSSSSPFYDHSSLSDDEDSDVQTSAMFEVKEKTETDDGIVFLHDDEKNSSSNRIVKDQKNSLIERHEKDIPTTYFYFVMELCQPESLRDRLMQHTIDRQQAWSIFDQIVQGIEYIHSKKLIHRDLKPSNILFSMDNTVKIGDFGLVSAFGEDKSTKKRKYDDDKFDRLSVFDTASVTSDAGENNEIGGTILYMSPEQINRQSYNQKVDIYAMGIILFELLYPFSTQMGRIQALTKVRQNPPVFPADFECEGNNRKQWICRLIRWLLSHSAHDRPKAGELRQDTFYHRMLELESPNLYNSDSHQSISTLSNGQDISQSGSSPGNQQQQRGRISSSPLRRTVSSSIIQSHRSSESFDADPLA